MAAGREGEPERFCTHDTSRRSEGGADLALEIEESGAVEHRSVLLRESVELLAPRPGGFYVDGTVGLGGHAEAILEAAGGNARLLGIDLDGDALERARARLERFGDAVTLVPGNFARLAAILEEHRCPAPDGILLDLGVSSLQLDDPTRGFSLRAEGPLDMRMSRDNPRTAGDLLRTLPEEQMEEIFRTYGEERWARKIARGIGRARGRGLETTRELAELVERLIGRHGRIHPATRVFQAVRIAVNGELENLKKFLETFDTSLGVEARAVVISFHSLEDRLVKRAFLGKAREGVVEILTKKPMRPSFEETGENPRARSAKLRAVENRQGRQG